MVEDVRQHGSRQGGATASVIIKEQNIYMLTLSGRSTLHLHSTCWFQTCANWWVAALDDREIL